MNKSTSMRTIPSLVKHSCIKGGGFAELKDQVWLKTHVGDKMLHKQIILPVSCDIHQHK